MSAMTVDFANGTVELALELWVGDEAAEAEEVREATRCGLLRLIGVLAMRIDPPLAGRRFFREGGVDTGGGFGDFPGKGERLPDAPVKLWLFVETWDALALFAANDCSFSWCEP
jgi:hypothetical protein